MTLTKEWYVRLIRGVSLLRGMSYLVAVFVKMPFYTINELFLLMPFY